MEYQTKKTQILSHVQFNNLLSFNLVQNKLERNFRFIVDAIMLNQAKTDSLDSSHTQTKLKHQTQIKDLQKQLNQLKGSMQQQKQKQQNLKNETANSIKSKPILEEMNMNNENHQKMSKKKITQKDITSSKNLTAQSLIDSNWEKEKNQILNDMKNIKEKLNFMNYWQSQMDTLKKDINGLKGQISTFNQKSAKSFRRESIGNVKPLINQQSFKNLNNQGNTQGKGDQINLQDKVSLKNLQEKLSEQANKEFNSIYIELNTLKLSFEELKDWISDCKKANFKHGHSISDLNQNLSKLAKDRITDNQNIDKELKQIKIQLMNHVPKQDQETLKKSQKPSQKQDKSQANHINFKNQLNDKISKLQSMVQSFITQSEFNRFKNQVRDQLQNLQKRDQQIISNTQEEIKKIYDLLNQKNNQILKLTGDTEMCNQQIIINNNQSERKNNICLSKIQELKKSIQNLKEDIEFYQSMGAQNQKPAEKVIIVESQNQNQKDQTKKTNNLGDKTIQEFKKYFSSKMNDLRANLLGMIRDLQKKMNNKTSCQQDIVKLWDKVNQTCLFLGKKADQQDTKKNILYLQKKLSRLTSYLMKAQEGSQDARIARTNNWYCLSCDKNLNSYQGKIGKHIVWDTMPLKGINKVGKEDKKVLPQLKR